MKAMAFLRDPIVGTVIGSFGIVLAVYFYVTGLKRRELSYYMHDVRTGIVRMDEASHLHVSYDNKNINGSVTAVRFAIWNAGAEPIRGQDVLETLTLHSSSKISILETNVEEQTRKVVEFRVDDSDKDKGILHFSWKILEENDGAVVQMLFEGDPASVFSIRGVIVGQADIVERNRDHGDDMNLDERRRTYRKYAYVALPVMLILLLAVAWMMWRRSVVDAMDEDRNRWVFAVQALMLFLPIVLLIYTLYKERPLSPFLF